ncbi:MAG: SpoIID/LytB domain-containing protein, partial [Armatimonadetes bacterium]|nr:SpoIID/LytB domain-containing protein [Armatimonadota bacterium]
MNFQFKFKVNLIIFIFFLISKLSANSLNLEVKVKLFSTQDNIEIKADTINVFNENNKIIGKYKNNFSLNYFKDKIKIDSGFYNKILISFDNSIFYINGNPYRGSLIILNDPLTHLTVINKVNIDDYLNSVLGGEISPYWPHQAILAQSIAIRTYTLYKLRTNNNKEYFLTSTDKDQIYKGIKTESINFKKALKETKDLVITYQGELIKAYYFSSCGGFTEYGNNVFLESGNYLKSVKCGYCNNSPYWNWSKNYKIYNFMNILKNAGIKLEADSSFYILKNSSGRVSDLKIDNNNNEFLIPGILLRKILGYRNLKSTKFIIKIKEENKVLSKIISYSPNIYEEAEDLKLSKIKDLFLIVFSKGSFEEQIVPITVLSATGIKRNLVNLYVLSIKKELRLKSKESKIVKNIEKRIPLEITFLGFGWGHGVGLCQWGAKGMAEAGYNFQEILKY